MSSTNTEQVMPAKLAQALASPLFPALDGALRPGRHIGLNELDNHAFLMDFQEYLEEFCAYYNIELIHVPGGFFYLRPRSITLVPRSASSELDTMVGKILCYLYLSPEQLANEGIFTQWEPYGELPTLVDKAKLLKLTNNRSTGSDVGRQKLQRKVRPLLNRLRRLGMVWFTDHDSSKFRITELVLRFRADVRAGDDPREAQHHLVRDGGAMPIENHLRLDDETEESQLSSEEEE